MKLVPRLEGIKLKLWCFASMEQEKTEAVG